MRFKLLTFTQTLALLTQLSQCRPQESFSARCKAFIEHLGEGIKIDGYQINVQVASYLPANSTIDHATEGVHPTCDFERFGAPPLPINTCRLRLQVPTSPRSGFTLEAWFPETWSGRFLATGNGGLSGCIQYPDIAMGTDYGFATIGTNNGHDGQSAAAFLGNEEVLRDFAWRALYAGTKVGKALTKRMYEKKAKKAYYIGCSSGGRMGWKAVQDYPEAFDGVVVGAPAFDLTPVGIWSAVMVNEMGFPDSPGYLSEADWAKVIEVITQQCDGLDGAVDGILEDARACKPDLTGLLCGYPNSGSEWCLTSAQLAALKKMHSPLVLDGKPIHLGTTWIHSFNFPGWMFMDQEFIAYVYKQDPNWSITNFTLQDARDSYYRSRSDPFEIESYNPDISKFRNRGGKVLHWHGQSDHTLVTSVSDRYYDMVLKELRASPKDLDNFYRYFRISGMEHCYGGPGADAIGQGRAYSASKRAEDSVLTRIVEWVEKGKAPEFVRGTKFVNDNPAEGIVFQRKHCKHPLVNRYFGKGNGTDERGWRCVKA